MTFFVTISLTFFMTISWPFLYRYSMNNFISNFLTIAMDIYLTIFHHSLVILNEIKTIFFLFTSIQVKVL